MAKLKDDPAVQALLDKALMKASASETKALKAQAKVASILIKDTTTRHLEEAADKATKKALKALGGDILAAVKEV